MQEVRRENEKQMIENETEMTEMIEGQKLE